MPRCNLLTLGRKVLCPHRWFRCDYQLRYQDEPLPGLYETDKGSIFLVAVKDITIDADFKSGIHVSTRPSSIQQSTRKTRGSVGNPLSTASSNTTKSSSSLSNRRYSRLQDYRYLSEPLECRFNKVTRRWMFAQEVEDRTVRYFDRDGFYTVSSAAKDEKPQVEWFALDDGVSWVQARIKGRRTLAPYSLYCVDESDGGFRRQTRKECADAHERLAKCKGRFFLADDDKEGHLLYKEVLAELREYGLRSQHSI